MIVVRTTNGVSINTRNYGRLVLPDIWDKFTQTLDNQNREVGAYDLLRYFGLWLDQELTVDDVK